MRFFLFILFFFLQQWASGQTSIRGRVSNQENEPLAYAKVRLKSIADTTIVKTVMTDKTGSFSLSVEKQDYSISVHYLGKMVLTKKLKAIELKNMLILKVNLGNQIKSVTLKGHKKAVTLKADRLIFNPESFAGATVGDAMDVLKVTPRVQTTGDKLSIFGKKGVIVQINGRREWLSGEALTDYLKNIQADQILQVEVISNPPAQYEAEGDIGIINLVLKKTPDDSWNGLVGGSYTQGKYGYGGPRAGFNYRKNKLSAYFNTSYLDGHYATEGSATIDYTDTKWIERSKGKQKLSTLSTLLGADYQLSKNWSLGIKYSGSYRNPEGKNVNITTLTPGSGIIISDNQSKTKPNLNTFNLHSNLTLDSLGRTISIDVDALDYNLGKSSEFHSITTGSTLPNVPNSQQKTLNTINRQINNYVIKADVTHPFKKWNFNYGTRFSFNKTDNDIKVFNALDSPPTLNDKQSNLFKYKENTQALYVSAGKSFGKKWETKLGLRAEYTQLEGNSVTLNEKNKGSYLEWFPTFYLSYAPGKKNSFSFQYSRRIDRPNFYALNPFKYYTNPYSSMEGNPNLKPFFTTNIQLSHVFKGVLQTVLLYCQERDVSAQVQQVNAQTRINETIRLNFFNDYFLAIYQGYSFNKLKWWNSNTSYYMGYLWSKSKIYPITPKSSKSFMAGVTTNNSFVMNKKQTIFSGIDFSYTWPFNTGSFNYNRKRAIVDVYLKMNLMDKKFQLKLSGNNLLKEYDINNTRLSNNILVENKGYYDSRTIALSLTYRFGSKKLQVNKHKNANQQEKNRL